jgi:hypothetical protein
MVLVSLQREFRNREMDIPVIIDRQAIPEHQHVEQRHSIGQPRPQVAPRPMAHLLQPADRGQERQYRLHHHPHIPRAPRADLLVGWITRPAMKGTIRQDHHRVLEVGDQLLERVVGHGGSGIIPGHNQAIAVDHIGQLRAYDPAMVGQPLAADLLVGAIFAPGMAQLDAIGVRHAQQRRLRQKILGPVGIGGKEAKQARALGQARKPAAVVVVDPAIEAAGPIAFECEEQAQRDELAGVERGLGVFGHIDHDAIHPNKQARDKIIGRHVNLHA